MSLGVIISEIQPPFLEIGLSTPPGGVAEAALNRIEVEIDHWNLGSRQRGELL